MKVTELQDIQDYWKKKYPTVEVILYPQSENGKYFGKMMTHNLSFNLNADTIGELISQGERFLRTITQ